MSTQQDIEKVSDLRQKLERLKGKKEGHINSLEENKAGVRRYRREIEASEKAQAYIQKIAQMTQDQVKIQISDLGSFAMQSIFPAPYDVEFDFQIKRGRVSAEMFFTRDGVQRSPVRTGGGVRDIGSIGLRFSCFALHRPRLRPIMILDEPLKWLKGRTLPRAGASLISEFSRRMKPRVQIIMVSHDPDLIDAADRVFEVTADKDNISHVVQR